MGTNFRKSKNFGAVRVNMSKSGIGVSLGVKGFRVGIGPRGTRVTSSIPGTGIYNTKVYSGRKSRSINADGVDVRIPNAQPMPLQLYILLLAVLSCVLAFFTSNGASGKVLEGAAFLRGLVVMFGTLIVGIIAYVIWWGKREKSIKETYSPVLEAYVAVGDKQKALRKAKSVSEMIECLEAIDNSMKTITEYANQGIVVTDIDPSIARRQYQEEGERRILEFIQQKYRDMEEGAAMLKTEKGKANRRRKFFTELHEDIDGLNLSEDIIAFIRKIEAR